MSAKYIFVTGGVTSSLGKGIIAASLAKLLQGRGYRVAIQKFDPYLNVDPGTMNPYEHGECYVTDDGAETDLDLGHYERFLNEPTSQSNNITTGRIYFNVITAERQGAYLGKTVQVIPHITDEIKRNFYLLGDTNRYDIIITEIGGSVGDIESLPFIEAVRQSRWELPSAGAIVIHLTLVPYLRSAGELKTKPTQHSVKMLTQSGVLPDILVCRSEYPLPKDLRKKIALFCNVAQDCVIEALDAETIYDVPLLMLREQLDLRVLEKLSLPTHGEPKLSEWKNFLGKLKNPTTTVTIGLVGKYVSLPDAYKSISEAIVHAGAYNECKVQLRVINSETLINDFETLLSDLDGIIVAPGFGERGIPGKINAVKFAREHKVPFFGICLGMQCAVIEFARNVLHLENANSTEMNPQTPHPVIHLMEEQKNIMNLGGTMRLGSYPCAIQDNTLAKDLYVKNLIHERHRHRYEFNNAYLDAFQHAGMRASGVNPDSGLIEIMEITDHPFFIGSQFHPELKSRVEEPHPLFMGLVKAAILHKTRFRRDN